MINILMPMGGESNFFDSKEYQYPVPLIEICNKLMISIVIDNYSTIVQEKHFIFVVNKKDCEKDHLDNVLRLLTDRKSLIIKLKKETKGAVCSALMAIDNIDNDFPLIIANSDQLLDINMDNVISFFSDNNADAGLICFETVHPRWSFARADEDDCVVETSEKRPISKNGIAGFYYFKHGADFVRGAMQSIKKDSNLDGIFFIAPVLNEFILENKLIKIFRIPNDKLHTFYSPQKIKEYEQQISPEG